MKSKFFNFEQRSQEWFDWRKEAGFVSASDCPAMMGDNYYCSPCALWCYKMGSKKRPDLSSNIHVQRGVDLKDEALSKVYGALGVDPYNDVGHCGQRGNIKVSLDGLYMDGTTDCHSLVPVCIKYPDKAHDEKYNKYYWELVAQAYVYDAPFVVFAQYVGGELYLEEIGISEEDKVVLLKISSEFLSPNPFLFRLETDSDIDTLLLEYETNATYVKGVADRQDEIKQQIHKIIIEQERQGGFSYGCYALGNLQYYKDSYEEGGAITPARITIKGSK